MKPLLLYLIGLLFFCLKDAFHARSFDAFVVAGRRQGLVAVCCSMMATMIGASATLGVAARAEEIGFPAFWWLGCGAIGLLLQALFLSKPIRAAGANTLPELADTAVGPSGRKLVALIIALSWMGIIAAQFVAASSLFRLATGWNSEYGAILITAFVVTIYTLLGGQLSVVRTDRIQFLFLAVGFGWLFFYLALGGAGRPGWAEMYIPLTSEQFRMADAILLLFAVGGAYFLGPDITSRNLLARDGNIARKAVFTSIPLLLLFSLGITLTGIWAGEHLPGEGHPFFRLMATLPMPLGIAISIGLVSALFSSADTCLMNTAAIIGNDLLGRKDVQAIRILILLVGGFATILALWGEDILKLLLAAYSIYTPGVVCPLAVAILAAKKRHLHTTWWITAVSIGGLFGLLQPVLTACGYTTTAVKSLPPFGMILSLLLALYAWKKGESSIISSEK